MPLLFKEKKKQNISQQREIYMKKVTQIAPSDCIFIDLCLLMVIILLAIQSHLNNV